MKVPETAMILAAGLATRMRPITDNMPKALIGVAGKPVVDHAIDRLIAVGVRRVVVNLHYKGEMLARHLAERRGIEIILSLEPDLLDSGGGIFNALPHLGDTFYVINGDVFWLNGKLPALARLAHGFDADHMDGLLLLQRTVSAVGLDGPGDFSLDPMGLLRWREEREIAPFFFAGLQLLHRRFFAGAENGKFSLRPFWTRAIAARRLFGLVHEGEWYHLGTPDGLSRIEARLASRRIER